MVYSCHDSAKLKRVWLCSRCSGSSKFKIGLAPLLAAPGVHGLFLSSAMYETELMKN